jgi:RNA polymerase sigma-70 factor (ECF subfamily)
MGFAVPMERPTRSEDELKAPNAPEASASEAIDPLEHEWIRRAQHGDEQAFADLVQRHQQRAYRIARHMIPSEEDARDLVQEAFLRVFRSLDRFDFQFSFGTWLYRIVTNLAIDHLRKRRLLTAAGSGEDGEASWESEVVDTVERSPSGRLESSETAVRVRECIAALAPHFQSVLILRELDGLPCTEIAKIVGATHVTVRWRLHRGRKLFQEEWERRERAETSGADRSNAGEAGNVDQEEDEPGASGPIQR